MRHWFTIGLALFSFAACAEEYLLRNPALSKDRIVFEFADDLWTVAGGGGPASRLTSGVGTESNAQFSPDGSLIAFSGAYDGNTDVFVVPVTGGVPKRLTFHPGPDIVRGWTPDGKRILFANSGSTHNGAWRLFTVDLEGHLPSDVPLPTAWSGAYAPSGSQMAYVPWARRDNTWKRYRGGTATPIWIADLSNSAVTKIPRTDSNDHSPMWIGDRIYFLSDRTGRYQLHYFERASKKVALAFESKGLDIKAASAGPGGIVFEQFGDLRLFDLKTSQVSDVRVELSGADLVAVRPRLQKVGTSIQQAEISPSGVRAVFSARGDVFTVPAEKGDVRNLTASPGAAERDPAWSPDGRWIAYFSDESGEYELHWREQSGMGEVRKLRIEEKPSFYYAPVWSPDSKKIAFSDKRNRLWYVDLEKKQPVIVDTSSFYTMYGQFDHTWSGDSQWLAYSMRGRNQLHRIWLHSIADGKNHPVTDPMSDARFPKFDQGGKYLYFAASTDIGPALNGLDMSTNNRPVTRSLYLTVLSKSEASPLAPESDEEKVIEDNKPAERSSEKKGEAVKVDTDGLSQRVVALPLPPRNYAGLEAGRSGVLFILEVPVVRLRSGAGPEAVVTHKFELSKRKAERFLEGATSVIVSANGEKLLYRQGERWAIGSTNAPPKPGEGTLRTADLEAMIDPRAEWAQMYRETWRIQRDFFYDPGLHGVNLADYRAKYEKYLGRIGSRRDLNYIFSEMLGEMSVGHLYVSGGDTSTDNPRPRRGGLLGADYRLENGRYRIARVYSGESWNPNTRAPLTAPGVNVVAGEYLLSVGGRELTASDNVHGVLEGLAGKSVVLRVGPSPTMEGSREVTVVPVDSETELRTLAWYEDNRRRVDEASGGKLAYVHIPDTGGNGFDYFNRYYFAQTDRAGVILDERWNRGGQAADYVIDTLRRPLWNYWSTRDGAETTTPGLQIFGPKVMIANEHSGSGGDLMPWLFKRAKLGPVVGTRTWGGLVGIGGYPPLIDGGSVTAPHFGFYSPEGKWDVENHGTDPDVTVELDPKEWRSGRDSQLEKAIELALGELRKDPPTPSRKPAFPNYHRPATK